MLYTKNVPNWERAIRIILSIAVAAIGFRQLGFSVYGFLTALSAFGFALTGFIGWCPMCAMVGRTLDKKAAIKR